MNRFSMVAVAAVVMWSGCKKDPAGAGGAATGAGATGQGTGQAAQPAQPPADAPKNPEGCNQKLEGLVADFALTEKCSPYTPAGDVAVNGFTLTLEPGVELKLPANANVAIGYYSPGKLVVKGTAEKPVKFTGTGWKGLTLHDAAAGSSLQHLELSGAGTDDQAALTVNTHDAVLENVTIAQAVKTALALDVKKALKGFKAVDLTKAGGAPAELVLSVALTAGVFTAESLLVPEGAVVWLRGALESDVTLAHAGLTYRVPEELAVNAQEGKTASLTLKEGVKLDLGENGGLSFGYYKGPAGFKVQGTKEKPVVITRTGEDAAATPSKGLSFFSGARAPDIDFLVLEYAGGTDRAALSLDGPAGLGRISNSIFRHTKGPAISITGAKERFTAFDGNRFEDVAGPAVQVPLEFAHGIAPGNVFTETSRVVLSGATKKDVTLEALNQPWVVEGELTANGEDTKPAIVTIAAGTTLQFAADAKLMTGYYAPAGLVAKGTAEKPVTFSAFSNLPWNGVAVVSRGRVELENVVISGTKEDVFPLDVGGEVSGTVKAVTLKATKKGAHVCAKGVKAEGLKADKGVKASEACE